MRPEDIGDFVALAGSSGKLLASGAASAANCALMKLAVLNPGGNDPEQTFPDFAGAPDENTHAPVNYHAFAACTGGGFYRKASAIPAEVRAVVLLLRHNLKPARGAVVELRQAKKVVAIAWKEAGAQQVAAQLSDPGKLRLFREICERCDGAIATTPDLVPLFHALGVPRSEFIPTPYPFDDARWDRSIPEEERRGIFVGTREFRVPARQHLVALLLIQRIAAGMGEPVTVFNLDGWRGRRMLDALRYPEGMLRVIEGRVPYPTYLRVMSKHRLVFQLDASAVPGQVAGDALLCRIPCIGGNGAIERIAFPDLCGHGRTHEQLFDFAARLLEHPHDCAALVTAALERAQPRLSFEAGKRALENFFAPSLRAIPSASS